MSRGAQPAGVDTRGRTNGQSGTSATVLASADTTEVVIIPGASSPSSGDVITSTASDFKAPDLIKEASFRTHVVERGDVLSKIAIRYQTTVAELQALNELNGTVIHVGQKLVYPSQQ
ncbi:MAG: LysM peptidoglycan-binding domain-containing protein [Gammaproteobacteria bacterium]|nr:LysM peptidoglycan-binding domain-containing protein [Gammaproteobacteria bacterium]